MFDFMKQTGKAKSVPEGIIIATIISIIETMLLSFIIAYSLNTELITWEQAGYWIMIVLFIVSFSGAKCAITTVRRQRVLLSIMSGTVYWGILLCISALLWNNGFEAVWETGSVIIAGCGAACFISMPTRNKHRNNRRKISLS